MSFVAIFLVNAGLSFGLSLAVASLIGPEAFGRYAIGMSIAVVLNTALFEGLRLAATRFYSERARREAPALRSTLDLCYACVSLVLVAAFAGLMAGFDLSLPPALLSGAVAAGLALALFDYLTALARARFLGRAYAVLQLGRATLAFAFASAAAWLSGDPALVLAGSAAAAAIMVASSWARLRDPGAGPGLASGALVRDFVRYGLPLVAASAVYQFLPLANRLWLADRGGFEEAGYFSLAGEIALRLFQNLGSALDLALFQLAVRASERDGVEAGERQVARNLAATAAILLPAAAGLLLVWPSFEAIFVPASFRGRLGTIVPFAIPAVAAYGLVQYGLNPVFQLRRRTGPVVAAAIVALAVDVGLILLEPGLSSPAGFAAVQLASFGAALVVLTAVALPSGARLPWRALLACSLATGAMAALLHGLPMPGSPAAALACQVAVGGGTYLALALLLDVAGIRDVIRTLRRRIRRRGQGTSGMAALIETVEIGRPAAAGSKTPGAPVGPSWPGLARPSTKDAAASKPFDVTAPDKRGWPGRARP